MMEHANAPTLITDRLMLSGHTTADFDACLRLWSDPLVTRFIGGRPSTREEVWSRLLRYAGLWALLGFGYWAIRERSTSAFVGEVGLADFHRDLTPGMKGVPEAGWVLLPSVHGQGLATEALSAVLRWSDTHLATPEGAAKPTFCLIHPDNLASVRVARKCGYHLRSQVTYRDQPTLLFERTTASNAVSSA
ncbi:GNAT family N-acetyltransferase [Deinococcus yavapaiensis]|uniref:RimJ/RimL family protein N-acetyltransferase n=1 Tax=Deinococcus yavapaiensis KR-236 TaxID=694435 RepID=A0A318S5K8_9DEIO|nr:GNAT family N-acetyltransferase [Deinococcus yavapaiensis]PYE53845.1 RimJ/RimL family protein N-acetyltransferase [Deinococcus yavapaiensis KR-236]